MALPQQKRKKIGEMLIAEGLLTPEQRETALEEQRRHGGRIGAILKSLGFVTEEGMIKTLGRQSGIPHQVLSTVIIDADPVKLVPELLARRHQAIPLFKKGRTLTLAMVDPLNVVALDDIGRTTGLEIQPVVATEQDVMRAIERQYGMSSTIQEAVKNLEPLEVEEPSTAEAERLAEHTPVVKFVTTIITQAVHEGARDKVQVEPRISFEPSLHAGMLVGAVIVHDRVQVETGRSLGVYFLEEADKFLMPMARQAVADNRAVEHTEGSK